MSGHSKWSTIKRKKGAADAKRSKIFSRIVKEMQIAVKEGGSNPETNARLRLAIANAKGANMPKDNVTRAISKADSEAVNFQEVTFEGYAPHGVAMVIECTTDNNQRTVSNIRSLFTKKNGSLGTTGSLSFIFDRKGIFEVPKGTIDADQFELAMIDAGAEDIELEDDYFTITTPLEAFGAIQKKLEEMNIQPESAGLQRIPNTYKSLDPNTAKKVLAVIEDFEELDDVQNVYHNIEMTDEIMNAMEE